MLPRPLSSTSKPATSRTQLKVDRTSVRSAAKLLGAWLLLNAAFNVRYPGHEERFWYLTPSLDVTIVLGAFAIAAKRGYEIPRAWFGGFVALAVVMRLIRLGDGVEDRFYGKKFNLYMDLALVPESVRLLYATQTVWQVIATLAAIILGLVAFGTIVLFGARRAADALRVASNRSLLATAVGVSVLASVFVPSGRHTLGIFGRSIVERFAQEIGFLAQVSRYRKALATDVARVERSLGARPTNLSRLRGADVYIFIVESYGVTAFDLGEHFEMFAPVLRRFSERLTKNHFAACSGFLQSPVHGGGSSFAHATLATGVWVENQIQLDLVLTRGPRPLARYFSDAGYHTVNVLPGTTRAWPEGDYYAFDRKYYRWDFDYAGPPIGWGKLPDQYILDFVRRSEEPRPRGPAFFQYALVSTHAPWAEVPPIIDDWTTIGDGRIYETRPIAEFDVSWSNLEDGERAYLEALAYDFAVLSAYLERYVSKEALVLVLGDHQPAVQITGPNSPSSVPIHAISSNPTLLLPFERWGYTSGLFPHYSPPHLKMSDFMPRFLKDFSTEPHDD